MHIQQNSSISPDEPDIQDDPQIPWAVHAAEIKRLVDYSHQCDSIMTKALASDIIYTEELLTDILEAIAKVRDLSTSMEKDCAETLHKIRESSPKNCIVQADADFTSLRHPAEYSVTKRSKTSLRMALTSQS